MENHPLTVWIITEGMAGTENQCRGVAEALNIPVETKRLQLRQPWKLLSPLLGLECALTFKPPLRPPWPDLLLASGRKSIAAARYIRRKSGSKTFTVQIQDPRVSTSHFDLVAVPEHDPARGPNIIVTTGAPNRITIEKLDRAGKTFPALADLKTPRVAVLFGGDSKAYNLTDTIIDNFIKAAESLECSFMITASRRTGAANIARLKTAFTGKNACFWDGTGENPYFAYLAYADYIIVTGDSVSMISDAATTGKPVYIIPLMQKKPNASARLTKFLDHLKKKGIIREFTGTLEKWTYEPLQDSQKIADEIKNRFLNRFSNYKNN